MVHVGKLAISFATLQLVIDADAITVGDIVVAKPATLIPLPQFIVIKTTTTTITHKRRRKKENILRLLNIVKFADISS